MDKKLTDNDIKKALGDCIKHNGSCYECPSFEFCDKNDCETTMEMVLTYINRLEAERDNLKETLDRVIGETKGLRETNKELQAENERLKEENQEQDQAVLNALRKVRKIRLDAYKEFAERLKADFLNDEQIVNMAWVNAINHIDRLVKEMVGENNGT